MNTPTISDHGIFEKKIRKGVMGGDLREDMLVLSRPSRRPEGEEKTEGNCQGPHILPYEGALMK